MHSDYKVYNRRHKLVTIMQNYRNKIDAKNAFARQKGYKDWGQMTVKFRNANNDLNQPPFIIKRA